MLEAVKYEDGRLYLLDQTLLPLCKEYVEIVSLEQGWDAIRRLVVRGAPAIGVAAAYMLALSMGKAETADRAEFLALLRQHKEYLDSARPTAVNLHWALERMEQAALGSLGSVAVLQASLTAEAIAIHQEDIEMCRQIGEHGAALLKQGMGVLTHCNAGALATTGIGTALAPLYTAAVKGISFRVYADETRPLLQGSRLTAYELQEAGLDVTVLCDNMAAVVMAQGLVDLVITGADHVAANGDTANKIGTYGLAVLAKAHGIPFYIACPASTFSPAVSDGSQIVIEHRDGAEVTHGMGKQTAPHGVKVFNPAFDITPAHLITGFITEKGIVPNVATYLGI